MFKRSLREYCFITEKNEVFSLVTRKSYRRVYKLLKRIVGNDYGFFLYKWCDIK